MNIKEYKVANRKNVSSEGMTLGSSAKAIGWIIKMVKVILLIIITGEKRFLTFSYRTLPLRSNIRKKNIVNDPTAPVEMNTWE